MNSSMKIKNKLRKSIAIVALSSWSFSCLHASNHWEKLLLQEVPTIGDVVLKPNKFVLHSTNTATLKGFLNALPSNAEQAKLMDLPTPEGGLLTFKVWQTSIMESPLQSKFNEIRTFTAVAVSNPNITAKLDYTIKGFHAMIFDGSNTFFIDPYSNIDDGYYQVYYKKDYQRSFNDLMHCEVGNNPILEDPTGNENNQQRQFGNIKRTFRLALSCTGEYAVAVAGSNPTKAAVLSAMVTTMNRVNGIYERELGTTMVMIANNDTLIYTSPSTDPFTANFNGPSLLNQNQNNTTNLIGNANYDIGHIFSTGGGGIAGLGVVCRNNQKARGVTGSSNPVGDPFDVDYVSHEMGHQFDANHSFNTCSGTENQSTAYEPGGGTTIMAYAGICGNVNNLQQNSDAYFHSVSLREISNFLENEATCSVDETSAISLPSVNNINAQYYIPLLSYFELEAPAATVVNSDTLTYSWEQWNLGNFQSNESGGANFSNGPQFRSFFGTASRVRVFPKIEYVINNSLGYKGERISQVARTLRFRLTVRNILNGWGSFDVSDSYLNIGIINTNDTFSVTFPNSNADTGLTQAPIDVTWNVAGTDTGTINTQNVDIFLSVDGGYTYPYNLATNVPNTGLATVTLPDTATNMARIKVKGAGNIFFDISNENFRILKNPNPPVSTKNTTLQQLISIYPNPASNYINISNNSGRKMNVTIINTLGALIWQAHIEQDAKIPAATYAKGIYYINITDLSSGAQLTKKLVIQ